ncbi:hypothetical protein P167DRAFT_598211 [Morchella conica CCBAS932]|uniref:Uncharacterized protein n=1 Tax=Morchella conica CCBAS932 TaxID=1392247 RepID=A0A3N4KAS2_9PEZI|nr:hypothetical protein P167DRAFT_598211 [Morchella conica CCBAS932]
MRVIYVLVIALYILVTALITPSTALPDLFARRSIYHGPLRTCYETVQADKNWFAIAWKSGNEKDKTTCKSLKSLIGKQVKLKGFNCFWYWSDRGEEGITKATGYLERKEGMARNALTGPVESLWGEGAVKHCACYEPGGFRSMAMPLRLI